MQTYQDVPGVGRDIALATTGIKLDGAAPTVDAPPPMLGEHSDMIWRELGLSEEEVAALRGDGVI